MGFSVGFSSVCQFTFSRQGEESKASLNSLSITCSVYVQEMSYVCQPGSGILDCYAIFVIRNLDSNFEHIRNWGWLHKARWDDDILRVFGNDQSVILSAQHFCGYLLIHQ